MQDFNLSFYFQPALLSHSTILPLYLFTELLLRHVHHPFKLDPIVVLDAQRILPVVRLQILQCLENQEMTTRVKELFDVFPLALS